MPLTRSVCSGVDPPGRTRRPPYTHKHTFQLLFGVVLCIDALAWLRLLLLPAILL